MPPALCLFVSFFVLGGLKTYDMNSALTLVVALLALTGAVLADTPANCTNTQALGIWEFHLGR